MKKNILNFVIILNFLFLSSCKKIDNDSSFNKKIVNFEKLDDVTSMEVNQFDGGCYYDSWVRTSYTMTSDETKHFSNSFNELIEYSFESSFINYVAGGKQNYYDVTFYKNDTKIMNIHFDVTYSDYGSSSITDYVKNDNISFCNLDELNKYSKLVCFKVDLLNVLNNKSDKDKVITTGK